MLIVCIRSLSRVSAIPSEREARDPATREVRQTHSGIAGTLGQPRRWKPQLLKRAAEHGDLDLLEIEEPMLWTHDLDPTAVHAGNDAIQLAERVIAVLCFPQRAAIRVERHAEGIAMSVRKDLLEVGAD